EAGDVGLQADYLTVLIPQRFDEDRPRADRAAHGALVGFCAPGAFGPDRGAQGGERASLRRVHRALLEFVDQLPGVRTSYDPLLERRLLLPLLTQGGDRCVVNDRRQA